MNYTDGQYFDAPGVSVTTGVFGSVYSLLNLSELLIASDEPELVEYFVQRGYTADVSIRAAPYDWRLGASKYENYKGLY